MKVMLKLILDCTPDAAWRALQSPTVFREVSAPFLTATSLEAGGFPATWPEGKNRIEMEAFGLLPMGRQVIDIDRSRTQHAGVRIVRDKGYGVSGALSLTTEWDHRMAVAADPAGTGKTLYRDRLVVSAGLLTPAVWASLWAFWQIRGLRLQQLAPHWAYEPGLGGDGDGDGGGGGRGDDGDDGFGGGGGGAAAAGHEPTTPAEVLAGPVIPGVTRLGVDPDLVSA